MADLSLVEPLLPRDSSEEAAETEKYPPILDGDLPDPLSNPFHSLSPPHRRLLVTTGLLFMSACFLLLSTRSRSTSQQLPRRVWLRAVEDNHAGLGSVVGQTRLAAALARAVDATLLVPHDPTGHGYSAADFVNPGTPVALDTTSICVLSGRLPRDAVTNLSQDARRFCDTGSLSRSLELLRKCTLIVDDRPWEYRRDFADCTSEWWDKIVQFVSFLPSAVCHEAHCASHRVPTPPKMPTRERKTVLAVHVRWGDTQGRLGFDAAGSNATMRSVPLAVAEAVITTLGGCRELEVHVYMENGVKDLFPLSHSYTLHDGKGASPLDELRQIASADIRLTATGGFASLIHWSARHGLSIVPVQSNEMAPYYARNKRIKLAYQRDFVYGTISCEDVEAALATA